MKKKELLDLVNELADIVGQLSAGAHTVAPEYNDDILLSGNRVVTLKEKIANIKHLQDKKKHLKYEF